MATLIEQQFFTKNKNKPSGGAMRNPWLRMPEVEGVIYDLHIIIM